MENTRLDFEPFVSDAVSQFLINCVDNHNIAATGQSAYYPANFILQSERGELLGGLLGQIWGQWLHVKTLWVAEPIRKQGHGSRLLVAAESYATERRCIGSTLDTHNLEACRFYQNRGYPIFGTLPEYPPGHAKFFLYKMLHE